MKQHPLRISGVGFPAYACGHCQQTLEAVPQGNFTRSVNGKLSFFGVFGVHKYISTITGIDTLRPLWGDWCAVKKCRGLRPKPDSKARDGKSSVPPSGTGSKCKNHLGRLCPIV